MTSGNAILGVYDRSTNPDTTYRYTSVNNPAVINGFNTKLNNLYPNFKDYTELWITNDSASKIALVPTLQITTTGGYWNELSDQIYMAVVSDDNDVLTDDAVYAGANWHKLSWWRNNSEVLPGGVIYREHEGVVETDDAPKYRGYKLLLTGGDFNDTLKNISMSGLTFTFNGTQSSVIVK